jgi:hypothetical protein
MSIKTLRNVFQKWLEMTAGNDSRGNENPRAYDSQGTARGSHAQKQEIKRGITPAGN